MGGSSRRMSDAEIKRRMGRIERRVRRIESELEMNKGGDGKLVRNLRKVAKTVQEAIKDIRKKLPKDKPQEGLPK